MQGLAEVAGVPLAGCGILGSAIALDKDIAKRLLREAGLPVARSVTIRQDEAPTLDTLETQLGLPVFLKPARQGSSVGVRKVSASQEFAPALSEAFRHDDKLIAEEFIRGREIECSVLEDADGNLFVSRPGEIVPAESHGFYSYDAKYIDEDGAALKVPADLPARDRRGNSRHGRPRFPRARLRRHGARRFLPDGGHALRRQRDQHDSRFTDISMYAKAMEASGISYAETIDRLVAFGLARAGRSRTA